jgi:acetoin utilization protein AcuB
MLVQELIYSTFPSISFEDTAGFALQLMDEYEVQHLPVVNDEKYIGLISKDELLDVEENSPISASAAHLIKVSVPAREHFLTAVRICNEQNLSLVPIINEQLELQGLITPNDLVRATAIFNSVDARGGFIVLEMDKANYSFGELNKLVETNDANIVQLNTYTDNVSGAFIVSIKINKFEVSDIVATFQRYDYTIKYYFGEELYENELKENYDLLMNYLKM